MGEDKEAKPRTTAYMQVRLPLSFLLPLLPAYLDAWPGGDRHGGPQRRGARKDSTRRKHAVVFLSWGWGKGVV